MTTKSTDALLRDRQLVERLEVLKSEIIEWATNHGLWWQAGFQLPHVRRGEAPSVGQLLYLWSDGDLASVFRPDHEVWDQLEEEFRELLAKHGYWYELHDSITALITTDDDALASDFLKLHRWHWIQHLAERRLFDVNAEAFEHFAHDPSRLRELTWRQFEEFVDAIFRNQGFFTELGPGRGDGGIDHRLYQSQSIPEIVAVVQAKKYVDRPIGREPVAALSALAAVENVSKAIFVTTSRYQPAARDFAFVTQERLDLPSLELADLGRLREWCSGIATTLDAYFQGGGQAPPIIANQPRTELTGKVVQASSGYNMTINSFAVIEADFPHEVVLRPIGSREVSGDGHIGTEVAALDKPAIGHETTPFVAFKRAWEFRGGMTFWGNQKLYTLWDGKPVHFNYCD